MFTQTGFNKNWAIGARTASSPEATVVKLHFALSNKMDVASTMAAAWRTADYSQLSDSMKNLIGSE